MSKDVINTGAKYRGNGKVIAAEQTVEDIMKEICDAHNAFAPDYDVIALQFRNKRDLCRSLFDVCKRSFPYRIEPDELQTTRSPAGIIALAKKYGVDCKHYAGFIAGVLDAMNRRGAKYNWCYRYASYKFLDSAPQHVFVVVKQKNGSEIWIDPVLDAFNTRTPYPDYFTDKKPKSMALVRLSGTGNGFTSKNVFRRSGNVGVVDVVETDEGGGGYYSPAGEGYTPATTPPAVVDDPYKVNAGNPAVRPTWYAGHAIPPGVKYYAGDKPLVFPINSSPAAPPALPQNLRIVLPATFQGEPVPQNMMLPIAAGRRLVLLPKSGADILQQNNYRWANFIVGILIPLVRAYSMDPDCGDRPRKSGASVGDSALAMAVLYDGDNVDVIDYVTMKPTILEASYVKPEGVQYLVNGRELVLPPNNVPGQIPPVLPNITTVYPEYYRGLRVPPDLPKPVNVNGALQLSPDTVSRETFMANSNVWAQFVTNALAPLVNCYSKEPYAYNDNTGSKLSDRVWFHLVDHKPVVTDFLGAIHVNTALQDSIEFHRDYIEAVGRGILKFINAGSRLAFLGLVRINAFAFAYKLFLFMNNADKGRSLKQRWIDFGGSVGALENAIILGCKNNPFWGGGVKQWIEDAVQDGDLYNGYTRPAGDPDITANMQPGQAALGVVGADDVVYYLAAASAVIAALSKFLKGIGGPETDKVVDDVTNGVDVLLTATGQDPIGTGGSLGVPVELPDPNNPGKTITYYPPTTKPNVMLTWIKQNPAMAAGVGVAGAYGAWHLVKYMKKQRGRG